MAQYAIAFDIDTSAMTKDGLTRTVTELVANRPAPYPTGEEEFEEEELSTKNIELSSKNILEISFDIASILAYNNISSIR